MDKKNKEQQKKLEDEIVLIMSYLTTLYLSKNYKSVISLFQSSNDELLKEIGLIYSKHSKNNILKLTNLQLKKSIDTINKTINRLIKNINNKENIVMSRILEDCYQESYYRTFHVLENTFKVDLKLLNKELLNKQVYRKIKGELFSDRIWNNKKKLSKVLRKEIRKGFKNGYSLEQVTEVISKRFNQSTYVSKRLVQTEVSRVVNQAQLNYYREVGIKKVKYSATLDKRTCATCAGSDGRIYLIEDTPSLPKHSFCRCLLSPYVDNYNPSKSTYNEFRKFNGI